jgi:hypothetical protein
MMPIYNKSDALEDLAHLLDDNSYFLPHGAKRIPPNMRCQVELAKQEVDNRLSPIAPERLSQIVSRLMLHFSTTPEKKWQYVYADYCDMLKGFPEDLLCAAYQHVLKHHKSNSLPRIADLVSIIDPEVLHRRTQRHKLLWLLQQLDVEVEA